MKKNRFTKYGVYNPYYFEKKIFRFALLLIVLLLIITVIDIGSFRSQHYINCEADGQPLCINPYYNFEPCPHESLCAKEFLMDGEEYGRPPSKMNEVFLPLFFLLIFLAFIFNHIKNNWRNKPQ